MPATALQLDPPLPLIIKHDGAWAKAWAHVLLDYGIECHLMWVCFLDATGECWTARNPDVRMQSNLTLGRKAEAAPSSPEAAPSSDESLRADATPARAPHPVPPRSPRARPRSRVRP